MVSDQPFIFGHTGDSGNDTNNGDATNNPITPNEHLLYMEHLDGKLSGITSKVLVHSESTLIK